MADNFKYVQAQAFTLAGAGVILGGTTMTLSSFEQIDGTLLTMANFGTKGFLTIQPGNGTSEEQVSFTGITQNANGTATITGISTVLMVSPYTETSGFAQSHPGGAYAIISNTSGFYNTFANKNDDETIVGLWTFPNNGNTPLIGTVYAAPTTDLQVATKKYVDDIAIAGAPNATTTVKGIVEIATQAEVDARTAIGGTGASLVPTPALARSTLLSDYVVDTGAANAYIITPVPAISSYTTGQEFSFKAVNANTTTSTINVSGLGVKTIKKDGGINNLAAGDIGAGQLVTIQYDGTNFQMLNPLGTSQLLSQFGDGADGDVTISTPTTLSRDMYYNNLVITDVLTTGQYRVFVKGTVSGAGTLKTAAGGNGGAGGSPTTAGTAGTASAAGYFISPAGKAGGAGVVFGSPYVNGANGGDSGACLGGNGKAGGNGIVGNSGGSTAGTGGTAGTASIATKFGITAWQTISGLDIATNPVKYISQAGSGGGGGGSGENGSGGFGGGGGGSGAPGGIVYLLANHWTGTFTISSVGGNGGNGGAGQFVNDGAGGGGAGGNGGVVVVVYSTKTWTGSYTLTGGSAGTGAHNGTAGATGTSYEVQINTLMR